jgi:hypothetical protein
MAMVMVISLVDVYQRLIGLDVPSALLLHGANMLVLK